jgi:putative ABC transport system substrate-binding protein
VDLIVTRGTPATLAVKNATGTIPVVMTAAGDPVGSGIVPSLARPGGNVTGLSALNVEIYAKRVELLRELVPGLTRIAGLFNMSNPVLPLVWKEVERTARSLGIQPQLLDVRTPEDLGRAFDTATRQRAAALVVGLDGLTQANRRLIVDLAAKHRLPAIYGSGEFVFAGGLITYTVNFPHLYYRAATYVDKILKGAKPADLPVERPTKFELLINLKAAKALGLTIPQSLLQRAVNLLVVFPARKVRIWHVAHRVEHHEAGLRDLREQLAHLGDRQILVVPEGHQAELAGVGYQDPRVVRLGQHPEPEPARPDG